MRLLTRGASGLWRYMRVARDRYIMGVAEHGMLTEAQLRQCISWVDDHTIEDQAEQARVKEVNQRRVELIKGELDKTTTIMSDQFSKIGVLIALLGFIIGFGISERAGNTRELAIRVVCMAAMFAVWAQMPRFKVFLRFKRRADTGLRVGEVQTLWDEYWYYYQWLVRRENTTNNIERLVVVATLGTIVALTFVLAAV